MHALPFVQMLTNFEVQMNKKICYLCEVYGQIDESNVRRFVLCNG